MCSIASCTFASGAEEPLAEAVSSLPLLRRLNLSNTEVVTDAALAPGGAKFRAAAELQELNVAGCWQISDAGLEGISKFPALTNLDISRCSKVDWQG
jgi:hypothetical protein